MRSKLIPVVLSAFVISLLGSVPPALAASAATVGNGIVTTDLNAVGLSPLTLAQDLAGVGVTVSNVVFKGSNAQAGRIHVLDPAVVSFNDGIILSSGDIANVVGPNKSDGITGDMAGPSDPDLNALIANTQTVYPMTFDATSLEFDFVPTSNTVYFTYVFGSDEYMEWVNLFNDVFAFYVNGTNCATVGTDTSISIDTINANTNSALYRDNAYWNPPANPLNIETDGLTVEMVCQAQVTPNATNHIKLAIADTSDQILDSVVMLKTGSFSTSKPESCNDSVDNDDDTFIDMEDPSCISTTTAPPAGSSGVGTSNDKPAFTGSESELIKLDASALGWVPSGDTIATSWTVFGINGTAADCQILPSGHQPIGAGLIPAIAWASCPEDGEYTARIDGWDIEGGGSWDTGVDFFVHNAPPAVTVNAPAMGAVTYTGEQVDLKATLNDGGLNDTVTCLINWGDGIKTTGNFNVADSECTGSHIYSTPGERLVSVTATDNIGDSAADAVFITVAEPGDVLPQTITLNSSLPLVSAYGSNFTVDASGGASGNPLIFGSAGGCTNSAATFTMTSGTVSCTVTVNQSGSGLYSAAAEASYTVASEKRSISIQALANTKLFGSSDPLFEYTVTAGSLLGEDALGGALAREVGESPGTYAITVGSVPTNTNYAVTFTAANFSITALPTVTSFLPTSGPAATEVTITGSGLLSTTKVLLDGKQLSNFTIVNDSTVRVTVAAGSTSGSFTVVTDSGSATSSGRFTVVPSPTISLLSRSSGGRGLGILITGSHLESTTSVSFGGVTTSAFRVLSATSIIVAVPVGAKTGKVAVTTDVGIALSAKTFVINPQAAAPKITRLSALTGGRGMALTITGSNLLGTTKVTVGGISTRFRVLSASVIVATVPKTVSGRIVVTTIGGRFVSKQLFRYSKVASRPTITSLSTTSAAIGATIVVNGKNVAASTSVTVGGVGVITWRVLSATSVELVIPVSAVSGPVVVTTLGGSATSATNVAIA